MPWFGVARAGLLAALVLISVACGEKTPPSPDHLFVPDGAGVIREVELLQVGGRVTLESGEMFELGTGATHQVESSASGEPRDLVIHGVDSGQSWVSLWFRAREIDDGWVLYSSAWELPNDFVFPSGMRLPKSPEFRREGDRGPSEEGFYKAGMFVANERGEIILVR